MRGNFWFSANVIIAVLRIRRNNFEGEHVRFLFSAKDTYLRSLVKTAHSWHCFAVHISSVNGQL